MGTVLFRIGLFVCIFSIILGLTELTPAGEVAMPVVGLLGVIIGTVSAFIPD
jgi:uncharacterized membrane protein HdeD (DUF308 family)